MADAYICRRGGGSGGVSLVLTAVGNPRPTSPQQNTIWVDTDTEITGWAFSATVPEDPTEGLVWITIGDSGNVKATSSVGDEWITIYPISATQYANGAWTNKTAKIYQNGTWADWFVGEFIKDGELLYNLNASARAGSGATVNQLTGYVEVKNPVSTSTAVLHDKLIDVTKYTKLTLYADVISVYVGGGGNPKVGPVLVKALNANSYSNMLSNVVAGSYTKNKGVQTLECDISGVSGKFYVGILLDGGDEGYPELNVYDLYLS
jgi:hypothetical protein